MDSKKQYIWKLADFLCSHDKFMSADELADHLNRNAFLTNYGTEYKGGRGTYKLISETYSWLKNDLNLPAEASKIATAFVTPTDEYPYEKK